MFPTTPCTHSVILPQFAHCCPKLGLGGSQPSLRHLSAAFVWPRQASYFNLDVPFADMNGSPAFSIDTNPLWAFWRGGFAFLRSPCAIALIFHGFEFPGFKN